MKRVIQSIIASLIVQIIIASMGSIIAVWYLVIIPVSRWLSDGLPWLFCFSACVLVIRISCIHGNLLRRLERGELTLGEAHRFIKLIEKIKQMYP